MQPYLSFISTCLSLTSVNLEGAQAWNANLSLLFSNRSWNCSLCQGETFKERHDTGIQAGSWCHASLKLMLGCSCFSELSSTSLGTRSDIVLSSRMHIEHLITTTLGLALEGLQGTGIQKSKALALPWVFSCSLHSIPLTGLLWSYWLVLLRSCD